MDHGGSNHIRQVILEGGLPWGFRIQGGSDSGLPLRIARVNPGSKAALQGIREGDVITSMNDQSTDQVTNSQAHALLKEAGPTLRLGLKQGSSLTRRLFSGKSTSGSVPATDQQPAGDTGSSCAPVQSTPTTASSNNASNNSVVNVLSRSDDILEQSDVPERPPRLTKKKSIEQEDQEEEDRHLIASQQQVNDPLLGIHSILSEMEREIRHTGSVDPTDGTTKSPPPGETRIGGLTIEEFIHFLALLERVKEQHMDAKEALVHDSSGSSSSPQTAQERTSPYDNIVTRPPPPEQPFYCHVATSPAASPPSEESNSASSSSSSSPCSSEEDGQTSDHNKGIHQLMPGSFSLLERLFLRRYLHVIPEEAASDCGSPSARLSRALSGLSSALSYLDDLDEDRFSNESMAQETDYDEPADGTTPVPTADPIDPQETIDPSTKNEITTTNPPETTQLPPMSNSEEETLNDGHVPAADPPSGPPGRDNGQSISGGGSADEFSLVTAMPAIIIDWSSSDEDSRATPVDGSDLPRVLEEINDQTNRAEDEATEAAHFQLGDNQETDHDDGHLTCLADCELLDESSLPISVLMIQSSACHHRTEDQVAADSEQIQHPTDECPCSLTDQDSDDDVQQPEIIDCVDKKTDGQLDRQEEISSRETTAQSRPSSRVEQIHPADCCGDEKQSSSPSLGRGETDDIHPTGQSTSHAAETVETTAGTSVVTLIDARIVSVDYRPVQHIRSGDQVGHTLVATSTLEDVQTPLPTPTVDQNSTSSGTQTDAPKSVGQMRKLWESRIGAEASSAQLELSPSISQQQSFDITSTEDGSDASTPVPEETPMAESTSDSARMRSIQEFRMLWSGWPPPPPLPPPPENYSGLVGNATASETETGYSTDGSVEPFHRRRRMLTANGTTPTPPPRPTPPRDDLSYKYSWNNNAPAPPFRSAYHQPPKSYQRSRAPLCYYSAPECNGEDEDGDDDDERVKARLLADWLVLANRKRSQSPMTPYRSNAAGPLRSNYSTLTSTTGTTTTSARESESESECERPDSTLRRRHHQQEPQQQQRQRHFYQGDPLGGGPDWPHHGSSSSLLSTPYQASSPKPGVWSPGQQSPPERDNHQQQQPTSTSSSGSSQQQPPAPIWIPSSQQPSPKSERKEFRPVRLEALKKAQQQPQQQQREPGKVTNGKPAAPTSLPPFSTGSTSSSSATTAYTATTSYSTQPYPWENQRQQPYHGPPSSNSTPVNTPASDHSAVTSTSTNYSVLSWDRRTTGSNYSVGSAATTPTPSSQVFLQPSSTPTSHLPKVPNPTVTLLQKAREGQLPKGGPAYLDNTKQGERNSRLGQPPAPPQPQQQLYRSPYEPVYSIQREYSLPVGSTTPSGDQNSQQQPPAERRIVDLTANKFTGVGPVSQEGVPIALRSGIREEDHHHWYRRMYESLHRAGGPGDYVTVRYKPGRGRGGGYQSEPDHNRYDYDSDAGRYATLDRRRQRIHNDSESNSGSPSRITNESDVYRNQPGRIEDYEPGRSSIAQPVKQSPKLNIPSKSFTNFALKESGYESDSQLVFRRRTESTDGGTSTPAADPQEQRLWYRDIQRGGEVPLHGLRKPQPDRPQEHQDDQTSYLLDRRIFGQDRNRKKDPWRYIRFKSRSPPPPSSSPSSLRRQRFLSVPAVLGRLRSRMFRGTGKRPSAASPTSSDERQLKSTGTTTKTTASTGTSTSSPGKGKTWRKIKTSQSNSERTSTTKKIPKQSPPSPDNGGFTDSHDNSMASIEVGSTVSPTPMIPDQVPLQDKPLPPPPVEDMLVDNPLPLPPPPPRSEIEKPPPPESNPIQQVQQDARPPPPESHPSNPPPPPVLQSRPVKKKSPTVVNKSQPALNVYLNQRQMVSQSKFRRMDDEPVGQDDPPKMTRYQKLARDTKNLVARISGEIPSTEKIRQALKLPAGSNGSTNGTNKNHPELDITDPEFKCDEQTAAILLAELEGKPIPDAQKTEPEASVQEPTQERPQSLPDEHYHYAVPFENRTSKDRAREAFLSRSAAGSPEVVKAQRFAQLRSLYRSLERLNELEKTVSTNELNLLSSSDGIIDFDLWRRLRQREKAQEEMRHLATWIQAAQREGECYFSTSPPPKWERTADPGLRIKEQSVRHLTDRYKNMAEMKKYSSQSLPRNFAGSHRGEESPSPTGRVSRSSQRRSSLTGQQMAFLKSQLTRVYSPPGRYETEVSPTRSPPRKLPDTLLNPKLYVRSMSETSRDYTLARLEQRRNRLMESQKALSIAGGGRAVHRSQSASAPPTSSNLSEAERRNLSMRLGAEVRQRYMTGQPASTQRPQQSKQQQSRQPQPQQQPSKSQQQQQSQTRSTRAAIRYVQQLSQHMSRKLAASPRTLSASVSPRPPSRAHQSRSSSRESSASSHQDYLLVLTPRGKDKADVESAVHEWAETAIVAQTPSPIPAVPQRTSSLNIRANLEEDSHSSNSSVQTVIHRDVQRKVDFFEKVIADSTPDPSDSAVIPFRSSRSVNDLRRSASTLVGRRRSRVSVPQRSQSLSFRRPASSLSAAGSMTDLRLHQLMERAKSPSPSPTGRKSPASLSGVGGNYLNLVKRGDVVKKCQYFNAASSDQNQLKRPVTPQLSSRSVPDSLPFWSAVEKPIRNRTVIKGQEKGDVSFMKRRYEPPEQPPNRNRFRSQFASTPSLPDGHYSWSRRMAAAAAAASSKKQVSFPSYSSFNRAGSRSGSDAGSRSGGSGGKKLDFTRVKPTLLSSARLAHRQAQTAADPTAHQHSNGGGRPSRPTTRNSTHGSIIGGSASDLPSTLQSSVASSSFNSNNPSTVTTTAGSNFGTKTVASPTMSLRSASEGSVRSPRSVSSPPPSQPAVAEASTSVSQPAATSSNPATTSTPPTSESVPIPTSTNSGKSSIEKTAPIPSPTEGDYQATGAEATPSAKFDPSLHQPVYRYTPPPPRSTGRTNRIQSVYDLYGTYPRHRLQSPSRPPLPSEWVEPSSGARKQQAASTSRDPSVGQDGGGVLDAQHAPGAAHRFAESEVTIHYRSPIRNLQQSGHQQADIDEEELRQMQAEHMKRVYEQERRRKYLQELEDIESRRHMDNFTPLMKSPIPLNRYDDFMDDQPVPLSHHGSQHQQRDRTPEPKIVARGLYNFVAQNARELSFQKGDIIFVRRQIDKNWYEGEHNAMVGIFPVNYVEIIPYDGVRLTNRKPSEGKARVKFNFVAQTPVELSLVKGELVIVTRQVDEHWLEGRIGQRRGIFPISYVDIIQPCSSSSIPSVKPSTTGGSSLITNGSLRASNTYRQPQQFSTVSSKLSPANATSQHVYRSTPQYKPNSLMIDNRSDPVLYRALYTYAPQNDDELELQEGDMICVLEKCDDGWYVGTSQRTGLFGTFPGNYVERV